MNYKLNSAEDLWPLSRVIEKGIHRLDVANKSDRQETLINLYKEVIREAGRLQKNIGDLSDISAAARNIFEIYLIIRKISGSDEAVKCWLGQLQQDALDIHNGFISLIHKHDQESGELELSREIIIKNGEAHKVEPEKPFNVRNLAQEFWLTEDYDAFYKLCSKLVHPSSIKINAYSAFNSDENYAKTLLHVAVHFMCLIAEHSKKEYV